MLAPGRIVRARAGLFCISEFAEATTSFGHIPGFYFRSLVKVVVPETLFVN